MMGTNLGKHMNGIRKEVCCEQLKVYFKQSFFLGIGDNVPHDDDPNVGHAYHAYIMNFIGIPDARLTL